MICIAVVDDEKAVCDELLFFLKEYEMKFKMIFDISIYYNGENLLADLEDDIHFDLILLEVHPFHFLMKPIQRETLFSCLGEYLRLYSKKDFFELTNKNVKKRIPIEQIQYFESNGRKITVYCSNESHEFYGKLSDLSEMKILKNFLMIHKSFYINIAHISSYSYDSLTIDDCRELPISKPNRKEVRRAILKYSADRFREE